MHLQQILFKRKNQVLSPFSIYSFLISTPKLFFYIPYSKNDELSIQTLNPYFTPSKAEYP